MMPNGDVCGSCILKYLEEMKNQLQEIMLILFGVIMHSR